MASVSFYVTNEPTFQIGFTLQAGAGSSTSASRVIFIFAEKNSSGTASDDSVSDAAFGSAAAAEDWFGAGSPGAWMAHVVFDENPNAEVWGVAVKPLASGTKAAQSLTWSGGPASAGGSAVIRIGGVLLTVPINVDDTIATLCQVADAAWDLQTGKNRAPVVASNNATDTTTFTADGYGTHYNDFPVEVVNNGAGTGVTVAAGAAALAGGVGAVDISNALTAIQETRTSLLVSAFNDTDGSTLKLDLLKAHINTVDDPLDQHWGAVVAAKGDTAANLISWADTVENNDGERLRLIGWKGMKEWHPRAAAAYAAEIASTNDLKLPRNGVVLQNCVAPDLADRFTKGDRKTCLAGGVCPGKVVDNKVVITRYITARTDLGTMDANIIDVLDYVMVEIIAAYAALGPHNYVPEGYTAYGPDTIDDEGLRSIVVEVLKRIETSPTIGYLYGLTEEALKKIGITYLGGGKVQLTGPVEVLRVVPGFHSLLAQLYHEVDA